MRKFSVALVLASLAVAALGLSGCNKKPPAPVTPPPAPTTPAPTTPAPTPPPPATTPTTPSQPAPPPATVGDLKTVYFAVDSYALDEPARGVLDADARLLRENTSLQVRLEGHCDERGTVEYNLSLGQKRADAVRDYLAGAGVGAGQLSTISYGKERPAADGHDESAWSKNRRVEFSKP